ncbi:MAG: MCE family protein [Candidatus Omnitrophica bacterium]|nr:MCE family protein [Candidatus Omnitrophota bacterium]
MPRESNLEVKVGAFVVVAIIALVAFVFTISDFSALFQKGMAFRVTFQYANGLKKGAPVRLAGVDTGHVQEIKVYSDPAKQNMIVEAQVWLMPGVSVPLDSTFIINQLGILGEKYLEIMPGVAKDMAKADSIFRGEDPVPLEEVMKKFSGIALKLEETLAGINAGILTNDNKRSFAEMLANISEITRSIKNGEGTVGKLLSDKSVYENLDEMTADLKNNPWKLFYRPKGSK